MVEPIVAYFDALRSGDIDRLRTLLASDPTLLHGRDDAGRSGVLVALYNGQVEVADLLLERDPGLDLFEAAAAGRTERVRELLDADAALVGTFAADGFMPLGLAAFFGRYDVLELLVARGADVNTAARNPTQVCPLHSAVAHRNAEAALAMAVHLLGHGADPNAAQQGGWTPLHQAAAHGHTDMVRLLLDHGADPKALSDDGRTPRDMAVGNNHFEAADLLPA